MTNQICFSNCKILWLYKGFSIQCHNIVHNFLKLFWISNCLDCLTSNDTEITEISDQTGTPCVFPFEYSGNVYLSCTMYGDTKYWCATKVDVDGKFIVNFWGFCVDSCPKDGLFKITIYVDFFV